MAVSVSHKSVASQPWAMPLVAAVASVGVALCLMRAGFAVRQAYAGAVIAFVMACWASSALPEMTTGMVFFALATVGDIAEPKSIFIGFASSAFSLVLGGMIVAQAMSRSGLGRRIAARIASPLSGSYSRLILGTVLISYVLAFLMPSNIGRIVLLMPIMTAIADRLGLCEGRPGRTGVVLAVGFGTFILSTTILPSNVPISSWPGRLKPCMACACRTWTTWCCTRQFWALRRPRSLSF